MAYHRVHGINTKIARIFNTYGPRMRAHDGRVVPEFICQALANKPLTVYGDGTQTRSFCYVSDQIEGIFRLSQSDVNKPVNIGNPHEMTVSEFARMVIKLVGCANEIVQKPLPVNDPKTRQPDISLAKRLLRWEPKVPLEEGLAKTIEYLRTAPDR